LYHRWWSFTTRKIGDSGRFLWVRNNFSTLISQVVNTVIFTSVAFGGWYSWGDMFSIMLSSYVIYVVTSLLDTPVVYLARRMKKAGMIPGEA
ncbi:MAG: queuosine precursor transporter, partial [Clostridia bacterium]|nr:queuosine precursor transporter [Clostridia bacterium]